ncbi:hypothetical protein N9584_02690 [Flavobacteriaceae bacterium]|nr:hypothetical protein [Flavobacteriaceae bacterium]
MSNSKNFVIAIGGTGMRCLESFVHTCAMGLYDNMEFNVLTLDTDYSNGNKERTTQLIDNYNQIKSDVSGAEGKINNNTFFSAKLNLFDVVTDYNNQGRETFSSLTNLASESDELSDNKILADLFLGEAVQEFNLAHGYRAQTHLGSYLMYHALVELARKIKESKANETEKEFGKYLELLYEAGADAKIFVFGSVFGGTGASSIPVIPVALNKALSVFAGGQQAISEDAKYGCTLLTEYFRFTKPKDSQKTTKKDAVIADSSFFTLNSQAALQFYDEDPTVKSTYTKMYHLGWPKEFLSIDFSKNKNEDKTITGGAAQKNGCHIIELLCATAAWDFFSSESGLNEAKASVLYKSVNYKNNEINFSFNDMIGDAENGNLFKEKFGNFIGFMHLVLTENDGALGHDGTKLLLNRIAESTNDYSTLESQYTINLTDYFRKFGYSIEGSNFNAGWLYQIRSSFNGKLILDDKAFTSNPKELKKLEPGKLFSEKEYHWKDTMISGDTYDPFVKILKDEDTKPFENQNVETTREKFIAHIYNAINKSIKTN